MTCELTCMTCELPWVGTIGASVPPEAADRYARKARRSGGRPLHRGQVPQFWCGQFSGLVLEFIELLELFTSGARQLDPAARLVELEAVIGNGNETRADPEKAADLQNREQHL